MWKFEDNGLVTSVLLKSWCSCGSYTASLMLRSAIQTLLTERRFGLCLISFSLCLPATDMHIVIQNLWDSRKKSEFSSRRMVELLSNDASTRLSLALVQYSPRTSSWDYNSSTWFGVSKYLVNVTYSEDPINLLSYLNSSLKSRKPVSLETQKQLERYHYEGQELPNSGENLSENGLVSNLAFLSFCEGTQIGVPFSSLGQRHVYRPSRTEGEDLNPC